jgi:DNA-directed RNA polymerase alpha subunit
METPEAKILAGKVRAELYRVSHVANQLIKNSYSRCNKLLMQIERHSISLSSEVGELSLSVRARNSLKNAEIITIKDLIQKTETELLRLPRFGRKSINEIREKLNMRGFSLGTDLDQTWSENLENKEDQND